MSVSLFPLIYLCFSLSPSPPPLFFLFISVSVFLFLFPSLASPLLSSPSLPPLLPSLSVPCLSLLTFSTISSLASPTLPRGGQLAAPAPSSLHQSLWAFRASGPFLQPSSRLVSPRPLSPLSPHYCLPTSNYPAPPPSRRLSPDPAGNCSPPVAPTALPPSSLLFWARPPPSALLPQTNCKNPGAGTRGAPVTFGSHPNERWKGLHIQVHPPCQHCTDITQGSRTVFKYRP